MLLNLFIFYYLFTSLSIIGIGVSQRSSFWYIVPSTVFSFIIFPVILGLFIGATGMTLGTWKSMVDKEEEKYADPLEEIFKDP